MTYAQCFIINALEEEINYVRKISNPKYDAHKETIREMEEFLAKTRKEFEAATTV